MLPRGYGPPPIEYIDGEVGSRGSSDLVCRPSIHLPSMLPRGPSNLCSFADQSIYAPRGTSQGRIHRAPAKKTTLDPNLAIEAQSGNPQSRNSGQETQRTIGTPKRSDAYPQPPMEPTVTVAASDVTHTHTHASAGRQRSCCVKVTKV